MKYLIILKYYFDVFVLYSSAVEIECLNSFTQTSEEKIHAFCKCISTFKGHHGLHFSSYKSIQFNSNSNLKDFRVKI